MIQSRSLEPRELPEWLQRDADDCRRTLRRRQRRPWLRLTALMLAAAAIGAAAWIAH